MKKRLRKKLHKGEFQELGFSVTFNIRQSNVEEGMGYFDDFMAAVENMKMYVGGIYNGEEAKASLFVVSMERRSVTPEERMNLLKWLEEDSRFDNVSAGELVDAWYGWE